MDTERVSLYKVYSECVRISKGEKPEVPTAKVPIYHPTSTGTTTFTPPTTSGGNNVSTEYHQGAQNNVPDEIPIGSVVANADGYLIVRGPCQHCGKQIFLRIPLSQI